MILPPSLLHGSLPTPLALLLSTCQFVDCLEMILLSTSTTLLAVCWALHKWMPHAIVFVSVHLLCTLGAAQSYFCVSYLKASTSWASFISLSADYFALCASTLWAHGNICSLLALSMSSNVGTSFRISLIIPSSLSPLINCSVSSLSYSLYSHLATLLLRLPNPF